MHEWIIQSKNYIQMKVESLLALLVVASSVTLNFPSGVTISNYSTLVSNVTYTINMTFSAISIPAGSTILMQFSTHYIINSTTVNSCTYHITGSSYNPATCSTNYNTNNVVYEITFSGIYLTTATNQVNLNLQFKMMNPMMEATEHVNINLLNGATTLASGLFTIDYTASSLMSCSYTSSNDTTGVNSTRTFSFVPSVPLIAGSNFVATLPGWFNAYSSNSLASVGGSASFTCVGISNSDTASPSCVSSINLDSITQTYSDQFTVSGLIASNKTLSTAIVFTGSPIRNPWSLAPFGPITYELQVYDSSSSTYIKSQSCTSIYQTVTRMNTPTVSFNINGTLSISTTYTSRTARLTIRQPFPAATGQFVISFPSSLQILYPSNTFTNVANSTSITFSSIVSSDQVTPGTPLTVTGLTVITPPSSRQFTITITTQWVLNGTTYGIDSNSINYNCQTGTLSSVSANPTNTSVNALTQYVLTFTIANTLVSGSFVSVNFPSQLTATVGNCSTNNSFIACSVTNTSYALLTITGTVSASSTIRITFPSVKNPKQAQTTSSFQIFTYYDAGFDSMVDKVTSGVTMTSTSNSISTASVNAGSNVTYAFTSYTFFAVLPDLIPANGYIVIIFPSTITFGNLSISSATFSSASCTLSRTNQTVTINSCFSADMTSSNISLALSGIYNPPSLQPTSTFSIYTYGPLGMVDSIVAGLTVTMNIPATSTSFTVAPLNTTVHTYAQYNLAFSLAVPHQSGDYITFSIPSSMAFLANITCSPLLGISSTNCLIFNSTTLKINLNSVPLTSLQISIATIRNYDVATSQSFQAFFYNSGNFAMETTSAFSATYTPTSISTVTISYNDQIALYQSSNLTLTVTTPFSMDSSFNVNQTSLTITPPTNFTINSNTTCSSSAGVCSIANGSIVVTSVGLSLTTFTTAINKIILPYFSPLSASFSIVYSYAGSQVATVSSGVAVTVYCSSPCERCVSTQTACQSCLPSPNTAIYLYTVNSSCLNSCPDGYYPNSSLCVLCISPCLYCTDSVNCTKCTNTTYLYGSACLSTCPPTYYGNSSNICASCVSPCFNCTSSTACTSCSINFYTNFTCVLAANCPSGTFGNTATLTCDPCNAPCATCNQTSSNCTSCTSGFVLYQNGCPSSCPNTYYNNSNVCTSCLAPCGNCTSASSCISCLSNYLSGTSCVPASSCPNGTFADNSTNTCATCPVGCSACSSLTNCTACTNVYFFFNNTCAVSCPNSTYLSSPGNICISCSGCLTCSGSATNCTSCASPLLLSNYSCTNSCLAGTYSNGVSCLACNSSCLTCVNFSSTCTSCSGSLYLSGNTCLGTCPTGTYKDSSTNNCSACDPNCSACVSLTNCSGCITSKVYYQGSCISSCSANYFNISGICLTCPNCQNCTSVTVCAVCLTGYYLDVSAGVCYASCPSTSIANNLNMICAPCNSSCATCSGTTTNCQSCSGQLYLLNGVCLSSCPSGYIASAGECTKYLLGSIVYFPFCIAFAVLLIIVAYSKAYHPQTEMVTVLCGILALLVWISWIVLVYQASNKDIQLESTTLSIIMGMGLAGIVVSIVLGILFAVWFRCEFKADNGFNQWACHSDKNLRAYRVVFCMTLISFPCFRIIYSRLFNSQSVSCFVLKGGQLLSGSAKFAFLYILTCLSPLLFVSGYVIYIKPTYDQTLISSIDSLLLDIFLVILLIIDTHSKDESFFDQMLENQPYLKKLKYDQLNHSLSSLRDGEEKQKGKHKSEIAEKDKEIFFRTKITIIDNLNKFGHLNTPIPQKPGHQRKIKTLPDDLEKLPQFDINQDQIKVIDDDFFFQEEERRRRLQEEQRLRLEEEEERKRKKQLEDEERERRRKLADEDMDEQHQVQFPDLAAIEKVERKGESLKKSPTHILNNFKKIEDRPINEKDKKKLEDMAKKNGLDPTFMAETFGIEKNHNPQLLNSIIDIHNHVDRQAIKALFGTSSNPEILQKMFSKNSTINPDRLRNILNDPESAEMIKNLASQSDGILSPDVVKLLLDTNSKYSQEFVKELLKCSKGETLDPQKIRQILKDCPDKASREAALKALKKIGGSNLENKLILENMLGEQSLLQAANFTRVANDLSKKAIDLLFREKSQTNNIIISKLLNNKKIDLKNLSTILEDPQLVQQLAKALSSGNTALEENILNLLKNGEKLDPQLLKDFLSRPKLLEKLGSQIVDPAFLTGLLKKDAKTDLNLLEKAIQEMTPQQISKVFEYNPEKNVDFEKVARLFEFNSKTDPSLIAQLLIPQIIENVYNKSSNTRPEMLNKLVEKGKHIDPESILKIYGDDTKLFRDTGRMAQVGGRIMENQNYMGNTGKVGIINMDNIDNLGNMGNMNKDMSKKYNNTDNNFNLGKEDFDDTQMGYKKGENQINMSRTDGRMLGFLSPIQVGQHHNKKYKNGMSKNNFVNDIDDIGDEDITEYNDGEGGKGEEDDQYQIVEEGGKRRRRKKLKKKPLDDIRLPSEHIYLQRLEAPHELKKKNIRKKKKKGTSSMQQLEAMDQDNQVYDLDF